MPAKEQLGMQPVLHRRFASFETRHGFAVTLLRMTSSF